MKNIFILLALLTCSLYTLAQPNIQHSIYFKEKNCVAAVSSAPIRYYVFHSNGNRYAAHTLAHNVYICKVKNNWDTITLNVFNCPQNTTTIFVKGLVELPNGHLLIAGYTDAYDNGNMWGYSGRSNQIFMMEVDTLGNHIKTKTFGTVCRLDDIQMTSDGYVLVTGTTYGRGWEFNFPVNGDPTSVFLAKFDGNLNTVWIRLIDNNKEEALCAIREVTTDRYVVGFLTNSTDSLSVFAEVQGGYTDLVVYYMDSSAQSIYWMHRYGSAGGLDKVCYTAAVDPATKDIYFVNVTEDVNAPAPTITYTSGMVWILRVDSNGVTKGSKRYGGYTSHYWPIAQWYEGKLWLTSYAKGVGGGDIEPNPNKALDDIWIAVIDSNVNLVAKYTLQSEWNEEPTQLILHNNDLYFTGRCLGKSNVPYKCDTANRFNFVFKLGLAPLGIAENSKYVKPFFELYPNPSSQYVYVRIDEQYIHEACVMTIHTASGTQVYKQVLSNIQSIERIDCSSWSSGSYNISLQLINKRKSASLKFTKQ